MSPMTLPRSFVRLLALLVIFAAALSVSACGRRGPLEPPPVAVVAPTASGGQTVVPAGPGTGTPAARERIPLDVLID